jgi:hypothetical protein
MDDGTMGILPALMFSHSLKSAMKRFVNFKSNFHKYFAL